MQPEGCLSSPAEVIAGRERSNRILPHLEWMFTELYLRLPNSQDKSSGSEPEPVFQPLTAGAAALLVNWGLKSSPPRYFTNREIKSLLIRGADRSSNLLYPNREWGYGTLNLYQIFQSLL